jgi:hypothetical protein
MSNQIETQLKKIEKEKQKLKILKSKIEKEKFEKVYDIISNNFEMLNETLKNELKNYYDFKNYESKTKNKIDKTVENTNNYNDKN